MAISNLMWWGVDPGSAVCGACCLLDGEVIAAFEEPPETLFDRIVSASGGNIVGVVIEDMSAYSKPLSNDVIDTCKFIGELAYRLRQVGNVSEVRLIARSTVKNRLFAAAPDVCIPRIERKMAALHARKLSKGEKGLIKKDGSMRTASFHYVDDRIVIAAVKELLKIPTPKPGKPNKYGLKAHSWQALAAVWAELNIF